jgi:nucleotide-binding universal stress UspA family protein
VTTAEQGANGKQTIVVGVDGSDSSKEALAWAARQAELTGTSLEVLTTWAFPTSSRYAVWPADVDFGADAKQLLDEIIGEVLGSEPPIEVIATVLEGHPAPILVERSATAALLVVGTRGHGGFAGLLLGSVSEYVTAHAHCPVVVVHHRAHG